MKNGILELETTDLSDLGQIELRALNASNLAYKPMDGGGAFVVRNRFNSLVGPVTDDELANLKSLVEQLWASIAAPRR